MGQSYLQSAALNPDLLSDTAIAAVMVVAGRAAVDPCGHTRVTALALVVVSHRPRVTVAL